MPVFFSFSISLDINNTQQYVISLGCYHPSQLQTLKKITDKNPSLYHLKTCSLKTSLNHLEHLTQSIQVGLYIIVISKSLSLKIKLPVNDKILHNYNY